MRSASPSSSSLRGGGLALVDLRGLEDFAALSGVAHFEDLRRAIALKYDGALHYVIRRVCGLLVEVRGVGGLGALRLARERRLVDVEVEALKNLAVGGDLLARLKQHDVAHHHVFAGHLPHVAVAHHLDEGVVVCRVEALECLLVAPLKEEGYARGQYQRHDDAYRLEEVLEASARPAKLVDRDAD